MAFYQRVANTRRHRVAWYRDVPASLGEGWLTAQNIDRGTLVTLLYHMEFLEWFVVCGLCMYSFFLRIRIDPRLRVCVVKHLLTLSRYVILVFQSHSNRGCHERLRQSSGSTASSTQPFCKIGGILCAEGERFSTIPRQ